MTKAGATYYYHLNGHGDVVALTDASGNVVAQYEYDAWGNILSKTGAMATANPYRYAGYYYDGETGLYYLMARYYDANMGRFITRDTFHGFENEPQSLNQYAYTKNNPVMYVDPNGNYAWIVLSFLSGGANATWQMVWDFYKKYKFNRSAWINKFNWKKFGNLFVTGGLIGIYGRGITSYMTKSQIAKAGQFAWDVTYAAKEYILLQAAGGDPITWSGLVNAIWNKAKGYLGFLKKLK
ncbi:hypothetical protein JEG43_01545 [Anoxybacillus sp. LAT_35]|nr:hypothetical protein [Anoxybacillus sp. LAT_11]MCG6173506.1 hypothetical protein [Anoxybacillus sp. LAT_11]MCG6173937.1 hypothetical protein [Anoxybacillus sp. LAT_31]MCG6176740.1 hypothetical protein [Anoxybacillus sp. LAT_35]MCG6180023.1 hypothetical protein [Anoxybacillus sp. LAT_33]